jgi:hypothetical protein|uniref:Uncharacterized protein n=1 Tax=Picea glauca TaxID=3330 RepID=A0A101M0X8_PICGL|nr:hypothetical protein ABT39_MTgene4219 [Picea glauca]QHR87218.1 hypothetical protein Q903MT_gene1227 [Picea sitchensis]
MRFSVIRLNKRFSIWLKETKRRDAKLYGGVARSDVFPVLQRMKPRVLIPGKHPELLPFDHKKDLHRDLPSAKDMEQAFRPTPL